MTGANYMGGKRNAAKARTRNTTLRVQKNFFGKQRLNNLSKCLAGKTALTARINEKPAGSSPADIQLAHAKRNMYPTSPVLHGFIPGPTPCTPKKVTSCSGSSPRSKSDERPSSCVISALDTTEPISIRAALDSILRLPDLAGLSYRDSPLSFDRPARQAAKRTRPIQGEDTDECQSRTKRQRKPGFSSHPSRSAIFHRISPMSGPFTTRESHAHKDEVHVYQRCARVPVSSADGVPSFTGLASTDECANNDVNGSSPAVHAYFDTSLPDSSIPSHHESDYMIFSSPSLGLRVWTPEHSDLRQTESYNRQACSPDTDELVALRSVDQPIPQIFDRTSFDVERLFEYEDPWKVLDVVLDLQPPPADCSIISEPNPMPTLSETEKDIDLRGNLGDLSENVYPCDDEHSDGTGLESGNSNPFDSQNTNEEAGNGSQVQTSPASDCIHVLFEDLDKRKQIQNDYIRLDQNFLPALFCTTTNSLPSPTVLRAGPNTIHPTFQLPDVLRNGSEHTLDWVHSSNDSIDVNPIKAETAIFEQVSSSSSPRASTIPSTDKIRFRVPSSNERQPATMEAHSRPTWDLASESPTLSKGQRVLSDHLRTTSLPSSSLAEVADVIPEGIDEAGLYLGPCLFLDRADELEE